MYFLIKEWKVHSATELIIPNSRKKGKDNYSAFLGGIMIKQSLNINYSSYLFSEIMLRLKTSLSDMLRNQVPLM